MAKKSKTQAGGASGASGASTEPKTTETAPTPDADWIAKVPDEVHIYLPGSHRGEYYNRAGLRFRRGSTTIISKSELLKPVSADRAHRGETRLEHILRDRVLVTPNCDKLPIRQAKRRKPLDLPLADASTVAKSVRSDEPSGSRSTTTETPDGVTESVVID